MANYAAADVDILTTTAIDYVDDSKLFKKVSLVALKNSIHNEKGYILDTGKKINSETMKLLEIQKKSMIRELLKIPKLYYAKSHFPLELSQRAFNHLWRVCESYELWCKETKQDDLILLNLSS